MNAVCNICSQQGVEKPFTVPWSNTPADGPSAALMKEHLHSEHGVEI